jgi:hypothetical protein
LRRPEAHRQQRRGDGVAQGVNQQPEASAWRRRSIARRSAAPWRMRACWQWSWFAGQSVGLPVKRTCREFGWDQAAAGCPQRKSLPRASSDSEPPAPLSAGRNICYLQAGQAECKATDC